MAVFGLRFPSSISKTKLVCNLKKKMSEILIFFETWRNTTAKASGDIEQNMMNLELEIKNMESLNTQLKEPKNFAKSDYSSDAIFTSFESLIGDCETYREHHTQVIQTSKQY